jgi:hypothetical protein
LVAELIELSIFNKNIDVNRLLGLKKGLLNRNILIDGFQKPYQVLIPFLTLGCLRLERLELEKEVMDEAPPNDRHLVNIVLDVLEDTINVLSATGSMPRPAAGN